MPSHSFSFRSVFGSWGLGKYTTYCRRGNSLTGHVSDKDMLQLQEGAVVLPDRLPPAAVRHRILLHRLFFEISLTHGMHGA